MKKKIVLLIALISSITFAYSQGKQVVTFDTNVRYFKVGSLPYNTTSNYHKLKIEVRGGAYEQDQIGEHTYYISTRNSNVINQEIHGGTTGVQGNNGDATPYYNLKVYNNTTTNQYDFFIQTSRNYASLAIRAWVLQDRNSNIINPLVEQDIALSTPTGTDVTSTFPINTLMATSANGYVGIGTTTPGYKLDVNGDLRIAKANKLIFGDTSTNSEWISGASSSLSFYTANQSRLSIDASGRVGIGSAPSSSNLKVYGALYPFIELSSANGLLQIGQATVDGAFAIGAKAGDAVIRQLNGTQTILFNVPNNTGQGNVGVKFGDDKNGVFLGIYNDKTLRMNGTIYTNDFMARGKVGIGISATRANQTPRAALEVNGTILASEVKVEAVDNFADFVFDKGYKLRDLKEVNSYIEENGHLPEIPSAKEVKENGMSLVEMQVKLLQKVEEMTLYIIAQQKRIEELEKKSKK